MKVIVNNYDENNVGTKQTAKYPKPLICDNCKSELLYDESDITIGVYGAGHVNCPLCGYSNMLEDEDCDITLTKDNIEYPIHFYHTSKELGAVDTCNNENVKKEINRAIEYFRKNKDEDYWFTDSGNMYIIVFRLEEEYEIFVTNDYHSTYIPFESEDY